LRTQKSNERPFRKQGDSINSNDSDYGIVLQTGMDKNQVVNHAVNKTKEVLENLNNRELDE